MTETKGYEMIEMPGKEFNLPVLKMSGTLKVVQTSR